MILVRLMAEKKFLHEYSEMSSTSSSVDVPGCLLPAPPPKPARVPSRVVGTVSKSSGRSF